MAKGKFCYTATFADGTVVTRNSDREYVAAYRFTYFGKGYFDHLEIGYIRLDSGFSGTYPVKVSHRVHASKWHTPAQNEILRRAEKDVHLEQVLVKKKECK